MEEDDPTDYIKYIRSMVGSKAIVAVGAVVIVVNQYGELLVQERSDNRLWCFPGGMLNMGESVEEAAEREFFEEVGIRLTSLDLCGIHSGSDCYYEYPNGDKVWNVTVVYSSFLPKVELAPQSESLDLAWVRQDVQILRWSPPTANMIGRLKGAISLQLKRYGQLFSISEM